MAIELDTPFKVQAGAYMTRVFAMWFSRHAWWLLLLLAACVSIGVFDSKWGVIAFILCLAALMMGLSLVYFNYAFSPLARWSVMEKTAVIDTRGIHFAFDHPRMNDHTIEWESVRSIQFRPDSTVVHISCNIENRHHLSATSINFLMLPALTPEQTATLKQLYLKG